MALTAGYVSVVVWNFMSINKHSHSISDTILGFVPMLALFSIVYILAFIIINDLDLIFEQQQKLHRR